MALNEAADAAIVAIVTLDGQVSGTGFVVDTDGGILTCHHVVKDLSNLQIRTTDGRTADVASTDIVFAPDIDCAFLRAPLKFDDPLALTPITAHAERFWTKGFHLEGKKIRSSFPVQGSITGTTAVTYPSGTTTYAIDDVLVLSDCAIRPGLSGAPVIDPDGGVVVGMVSTQLRSSDYDGGMAVPIARALEHPDLLQQLAGNPTTVRAYGRYLNLPTARAMCRSVTEQAIVELEELRRVDLERRVPREGFADAAQRLVAGVIPALALVGPAGVGKSTELAAVAREISRPVLLLRGSAIEPDGGLKQAVDDALVAAGLAGLPDDDPAGAIAGAADQGGGLVVIIDGLNELAVASPRRLQEWLAAAHRWADRVNARLIVSCRPDTWELVGDALVARDLADQCVVPLAGFTDAEYAAAQSRYDIAPPFDHSIFRIPLAMGLFARVHERAAPHERVSFDALIASFVHDAAERVARAGPSHSLPSLLLRLRAAAEEMLASDGDRLAIASYDRLFGQSLTDALVAEGLLDHEAHGYRFVYDDVGDWLKGQVLDPDIEIARFRADPDRSWRRFGPIGYALRARERREGSKALLATLLPLVDSDPPDHGCTQIVAETLLKAADATPYTSVLEKLSVPRGQAGYSVRELLSQVAFWRSVPLGVADRLNMLRSFVTYQKSYYWRSKDWTVDVPPSRARTDYAALALSVVQASPTDGAHALLGWLTDGRELVDREARINDVAMGILFRIRHLAPAATWEVITAAGGCAGKLVSELVQEDFPWLEQRLTTDSARLDDEMFARVVKLMSGQPIGPALASVLLDSLAARFDRGVDAAALGPAFAVLARLSHRKDHARLLINAYRNGVSDIYAGDLVALIDDHRELITKALLDTIEHAAADDDPPTKYKIEDALARMREIDDPAFQEHADGAVLGYLEGVGINESAPYRYVESRLYASSTATDVLLRLTRAAIAAPERSILVYALTSQSVLCDDAATRETLLDELIAAGDSDIWEGVLERLTGQGARPPYDLGRIRLILARLDPDQADWILLGSAITEPRFAEELHRWLAEEICAPPGPLVASFQERVARGDSPTKAAIGTDEDDI